MNQAIVNLDQFQGGTNSGLDNPITGGGYREWSDQLRDVEEMLSDPDLRAEAARIREQARNFRRDLKRHGKEPNWELVNMEVIKPLHELENRIAEELAKRTQDESLVPIDRDPVPSRFEPFVKKYYEELGSGR